MRLTRYVPFLCCAAVLAAMAPATASEARQTSLADIEDEVICVVCGVPLTVADAPQARREREFIVRLVEAGRSKQEIKRALVEEFGPAVLGTPRRSGFGLTAYLLPLAAALVGLLAAVGAAVRWRRGPSTARGDLAVDELPADDRARLEADLGRYGF